MESELTGTILVIICLFFLSGFFAGSEAAIFSLSRLKLKKMQDQGKKVAEIIHWLLDDPRKLLITILFCNLLVNTLLSSLSTVLALGLAKHFQMGEAITITITTAVISYLLIVISEVTPINLALNYTEFFASLAARPIRLITILLTRIIPLQPVLTWITNRFLPLFGGEVNQKVPFITIGELSSTITHGTATDVLEEDEREIIQSIFEFSQTQVKEIMTPRVDMVAVERNETVFDVLGMLRDEGFARIPVYEESRDNVIGIVHIKDLFPLLRDEEKQKNTAIGEFMWEVFFVPETKMISKMLREFQVRSVQMAIVIDEYGGTEGLVTMEDIIEEIVGEIQDEYDDEEELFLEQSDGSYLVEARCPMEEFNELFNVDIPNEGFETVGGLFVEFHEEVPQVGTVVQVEQIELTIHSMDDRRILKVLATQLEGVDETVEDGDLT